MVDQVVDTRPGNGRAPFWHWLRSHVFHTRAAAEKIERRETPPTESMEDWIDRQF